MSQEEFMEAVSNTTIKGEWQKQKQLPTPCVGKRGVVCTSLGEAKDIDED